MGQDSFIAITFKWILVAVVGFWGSMGFLLQAFILTMAVDFIVGVLAAAIQGKVSSSVAWRGIGKKLVQILLVAICYLYTSQWIALVGFHVGGLAAAFYIVHELISIVENCQKCGIPVPPVVIKFINQARVTVDKEVAKDTLEKELEHVTSLRD